MGRCWSFEERRSSGGRLNGSRECRMTVGSTKRCLLKWDQLACCVFSWACKHAVVRELNLMTVERKVLLRESEQYKQSLSAGITLPPLALFIVMLPKDHLTSHSRMSGSG